MFIHPMASCPKCGAYRIRKDRRTKLFTCTRCGPRNKPQ